MIFHKYLFNHLCFLATGAFMHKSIAGKYHGVNEDFPLLVFLFKIKKNPDSKKKQPKVVC